MPALPPLPAVPHEETPRRERGGGAPGPAGPGSRLPAGGDRRGFTFVTPCRVCRVPSTRRPATLLGPCFKTGRTRKPRSRPTDPRETEADGIRTPRDPETRGWTVSRRHHGRAAWTVAPQNRRGGHGRKSPRSLARPRGEAGVRQDGGRTPDQLRPRTHFRRARRTVAGEGAERGKCAGAEAPTATGLEGRETPVDPADGRTADRRYESPGRPM